MREIALFGLLLLAACGQRQPGQQGWAEANPSELATAPAGKFTEGPPATDPPKFVRYKATGTEPFWSVDLDGNTLRYSDPEVSGIEVPVNKTGDGIWIGSYDGKPLQFRVEQRACSDGMSDEAYDYAADLKLGDRMLLGCARSGER